MAGVNALTSHMAGMHLQKGGSDENSMSHGVSSSLLCGLGALGCRRARLSAPRCQDAVLNLTGRTTQRSHKHLLSALSLPPPTPPPSLHGTFLVSSLT